MSALASPQEGLSFGGPGFAAVLLEPHSRVTFDELAVAILRVRPAVPSDEYHNKHRRDNTDTDQQPHSHRPLDEYPSPARYTSSAFRKVKHARGHPHTRPVRPLRYGVYPEAGPARDHVGPTAAVPETARGFARPQAQINRTRAASRAPIRPRGQGGAGGIRAGFTTRPVAGAARNQYAESPGVRHRHHSQPVERRTRTSARPRCRSGTAGTGPEGLPAARRRRPAAWARFRCLPSSARRL